MRGQRKSSMHLPTTTKSPGRDKKETFCLYLPCSSFFTTCFCFEMCISTDELEKAKQRSLTTENTLYPFDLVSSHGLVRDYPLARHAERKETNMGHEIVVALGSVSSFTALLVAFRLWMQIDRKRPLRVICGHLTTVR